MSAVAIDNFSAEILRAARNASRLNGKPLVTVLTETTGKARSDVLLALANTFHMGTVDLTGMAAWPVASDIVPLAQLIRRGGLLFQQQDGLLAAISNPYDEDLQHWLSSLSHQQLTFCLALPEDIRACTARLEHEVRAIDHTRKGSPSPLTKVRSDIEELSLQSISEDASPVVRIVNSTVYDALKSSASDIHLESTPTGIAVRYRIDGVLEPVTTIDDTAITEQIISRIKVLAELDIAERRIPQDGRFRVSIQQRDVDIRVSIMPSVHGEDAVLRILDKRTFLKDDERLRLEMLGFDTDALASIRRLAREPYGMLLVTGPTGSGKTTTLYAAISEINHGRDKIITIEDPVEYELAGVLQIPVNEKKGLTFARGLRSILRHDPDKIMVGEIRDRDTAEIAVQSALTGHLVLTTVHANNVFDVFNRFTHMGIDPYALTSALNGIWAQRLVRRVCKHCAEPFSPSDEEMALHGVVRGELDGYRLMAGRGCSACRGSGYRGRIAIAEILSLNDELREMVATRQPVAVIKDAARRNGTTTLRESALMLLSRGETTLEEIGRVTLSA